MTRSFLPFHQHLHITFLSPFPHVIQIHLFDLIFHHLCITCDYLLNFPMKNNYLGHSYIKLHHAVFVLYVLTFKFLVNSQSHICSKSEYCIFCLQKYTCIHIPRKLTSNFITTSIHIHLSINIFNNLGSVSLLGTVNHLLSISLIFMHSFMHSLLPSFLSYSAIKFIFAQN